MGFGGLDPFDVIGHAGIGADGVDDRLAADLAGGRPLNQILHGRAQIAIATIEKLQFVRVTIHGVTVAEIEVKGDVLRAMPSKKRLLNFLAA